jgi:hypothetical protein
MAMSIGREPVQSDTGGRMDICVVVIIHKAYCMPSDPMYLPLYVGWILHPDVIPEMSGDDTGTIISACNGYYSNLTGLYWLWGNRLAGAKCLVCYRRYLVTSSTVGWILMHDRLDRVVGVEGIERLLRPCDSSITQKLHYYIETVYSRYSYIVGSHQFNVCCTVPLELHPEFVSAWDNLKRFLSFRVFNMFIMSATCFNEYCNFMFAILIERCLDLGQYSAFWDKCLDGSMRVFLAFGSAPPAMTMPSYPLLVPSR